MSRVVDIAAALVSLAVQAALIRSQYGGRGLRGCGRRDERETDRLWRYLEQG